MRFLIAVGVALCAATSSAGANEVLRWNACVNALPPVLWSERELAASLAEITAQEDRCKGTGIYEEVLAKAHIGLGRCEDALAIIESGLAADPFMPIDDLYYYQGKAHACLNQWPAAARSYAAAFEKSPHSVGAHREYAVALHKQRRTPEAIAHLQQNRAELDSWIIEQILALLLYTQRDCAEAAAAVDRALADRAQLISDKMLVVVGIRCHAELGDFATADRLVDGLLQTDPDLAQDPLVKQAIDDLASRRG